ncbi:MAG: FG-GAP-like repeat-containing protein [Gemmatimonadota bacterium]
MTIGVFALLAIGAAIVLWQARSPGSEYTPGEDLTGLTAALARDLPADHPDVSFTDVTEAAGIDFRHFPARRSGQLPEDMGSGAGWADYDNDGWLDLLLVNIAGPTQLYRNLGNGTFRDVTEEAGIDHATVGMGVAWGDYDDDGWVDVFLSAYGQNALYRNLGDGTFGDVTTDVGMGNSDGFWAGASWGDYDRDGYLDLYVTGYVQYERVLELPGAAVQYDVEIPPSLNPSSFRPHPNALWRNQGQGTFVEVAESAGVRGQGRSLGAVWADFDEDGWPDLYVANDVSDNVLYRNLGDGTFADVSHQAAVADYRGAMGLAVGDWDGDEDLDLFITHWIAQENALFSNLRADLTPQPGVARPLRFIDEADRFGLGQIALDFVGWGTAFFDYDHDGRPDLFVVNGSTLQRDQDPSLLVPMRDQLFWNRGPEEGFYDVSAVGGDHYSVEHVGRGAAFGDYDRDGDLDIVVVNHGGRPSLLRNEGGDRQAWIQLRLEGRSSNRSAIGSRVRLVAGGIVQTGAVGAQTSYLSHNSLVQHFGLGETARVDTLEVLWPGGGRQTWLDIPARQAIRLVEHEPAWQPEWSAMTTADGPDFWARYRSAGVHRLAGRLSEAADTYEAALALNPGHENALYYLASVRLQLGQREAAEGTLDRLLAVAPESARAHVQFGVLYACPGHSARLDLGRAASAFERASAINPEQTGTLLWLGLVALLDDRALDARRHLDRVLGSNPGSIPGIYLRGYLSWTEGRSDDAEAAIVEARELATATGGGEGLLEGETRGPRPLFSGGMSCRWLEDQLSWLAETEPVNGTDAEARYGALREALRQARASTR